MTSEQPTLGCPHCHDTRQLPGLNWNGEPIACPYCPDTTTSGVGCPD